MKNPMMQKVTLALSCAAVGLAVFDMTVKDARIHELTEERDIYANRFQNWSERAMRDEEAISERDDLLDKLLGEMDAVLNGEIKFEDAGEFHCTAYCTENFPHECGTGTGITASGEPVTAGWAGGAPSMRRGGSRGRRTGRWPQTKRFFRLERCFILKRSASEWFRIAVQPLRDGVLTSLLPGRMRTP